MCLRPRSDCPQSPPTYASWRPSPLRGFQPWPGCRAQRQGTEGGGEAPQLVAWSSEALSSPKQAAHWSELALRSVKAPGEDAQPPCQDGGQALGSRCWADEAGPWATGRCRSGTCFLAGSLGPARSRYGPQGRRGRTAVVTGTFGGKVGQGFLPGLQKGFFPIIDFFFFFLYTKVL